MNQEIQSKNLLTQKSEQSALTVYTKLGIDRYCAIGDRKS